MYTDFFVPPSKPLLLDKRFCEAHPALGMRPTAGSGSVFGDGDGRPKAIDYTKLQFAMEGKCRSKRPKHLRPTPKEWIKALDQLKRRNRSAIRLFVVYHHAQGTYAVSLPQDDLVQLKSYGIDVSGGEEQDFARANAEFEFSVFSYYKWKALYEEICDLQG